MQNEHNRKTATTALTLSSIQPCQNPIKLLLHITQNLTKKSHSFENGYQTWGGGMKNLLVFHTSDYGFFL